MKKFLSFVSAFLILWAVVYIYNKATDGFSLREIRSSLEQKEICSSDLSNEKKEKLQALLNQPYHYIGKGCQFYAFESADGHYVVKFFKHKHLRPLTWLKEIPMPAKLQAACDAKIQKRKERVDALFSSIELAYKELPEETGLLFIHLDRNPALETELEIADKLGIKHRIALDDYEYVIQKKALHVGPTLNSLLEKGEQEELRIKIHQLADLVSQRCQKGIRDRDRSFVQNVAFCAGEERAVFVDIGQFFKDESVKESGELKKDVLRRLNSLKAWASERYPPLVPFVEGEIALCQNDQAI